MLQNGVDPHEFLRRMDCIYKSFRERCDDIANTEIAKLVLPLPIKRNKYGTHTGDYLSKDWFVAINEKFIKCFQACDDNTVDKVSPGCKYELAKALTELITVCVSFQEALGYDQSKRANLQQDVNDYNKRNGYLED